MSNLEADSLPTPSRWRWTTLPAVAEDEGLFTDGDWVESKDQDPNGDVRLVQLADVGDGSFRDRSSRFLTSAKAAELGCTYLRQGDVLIARMPDPLGRACVFPGDPRPCVTVVDVCVVRARRDTANHRWLMHAINSPQFRASIAAMERGSTRKRISRKNLGSLLLPLPPLPEQQRIVAEIEKQLTRLEAGVAALRRAQANLKRYRAAVLKAACEGRLVPTEADLARREGREYEAAGQLVAAIAEAATESKRPLLRKVRKPTDTATGVDLVGLPEGWVEAGVEQLAASEPRAITDGPFGSNLKTEHYTTEGPRVIRLQNIGDNFFRDERAHISSERFDRLQNHQVSPGDIVIAALGEALPRACVVPASVGPAIVKADCVRFRPDSRLSSSYLSYALNAEPTRARTKDIVHGVGRPRLNLSEIKAIRLPIPPLAEQHRIVAEVERRLSVVEELEAAVAANLARAARLRQAILQRAFSGELVPPEPCAG